MSLWDAVRYGWGVVWWIQIGGVPVAWIERASGLTLPSGYTEDASLIIDDSAAVGVERINRENGTAASLSLSFRLLDTSTVRDWLRAPSKTATLTANLTATASTATVDDNTGWSGGDYAWLGMETIKLGGTSGGTTFTGLSRAQYGTLAHAHDTGTTGQIVTDRPRYWRGRDVTLWASPIDPAGFMTGTNLTDDAVEVWRGRITEGPRREPDGFAFEASSIDRVVDRGLAGSVRGQVVSTAAKVAISSGWSAKIYLLATDSTGSAVFEYTLPLYPFASDSDGDLLGFGEIRQRIADAWATARTDLSAVADLDDLEWIQYSEDDWRAWIGIDADNNIKKIESFLWLDGQLSVVTTKNVAFPGWDGGSMDIGWHSGPNPLQPNELFWQSTSAYLMTIRLDEGDAASIPNDGLLRVNVGGGYRLLRIIGGVQADGELAYVTGLEPADSVPELPTSKQVLGAEVEVIYGDSGTITTMMLRALMSSGTGQRSVTYDTLERMQGYGLSSADIRTPSFTNAPAPISTLKGEVNAAGQSFADMFGGALGLFRKAIVAKPDTSSLNSQVKLTLVDTAPYGAGYSITIDDGDLLSDAGDPVTGVKKAPAPTVVVVERPHGLHDDTADRWVNVDNAQIDAVGRDEVTYRVPAKTRASLAAHADAAAVSQLASDALTQAVTLRVGPWIDAHVGDIVKLDLTHPVLWTWSTSPGAVGYTGPARVVGRTIEPATMAVQLTVLCDASVQVRALSPSMLISAYGGTAAAPTTIDVPRKYYDHVNDALTQAGANIWLLHYQPGQAESDGEKHEISAVTDTGSVARLTVASTSGGHSLDTTKESSLTLPTTSGGDITTWQGDFAHVDDGTSWG